MKNFFPLIITIFLVGTMNAQDSGQDKKWTLQECVAYALENNISIQQAELDSENAALDKLDAFGNLIPAVNANATNSWNTGLTQNVTTGVLQTQTTRNFSAGISASVTLFDGLRNFKQFQRAKLAKLATQYSLDKIKDDISLAVANNFLQILLNKRNLEVVVSQNEVTKEQLDRTQELVDGGVLPKGDLLEIRAQDANEQQSIVASENAVQISLISLAQLLRVEDYKNFDISDDEYLIMGDEILDYTPTEIVASAKENRKEIKIAEMNAELAQKDIEIARGSSWPTLSAFVNYNTRESGAGQYLDPIIDPDEPTREIGFVESTGDVVVSPNTLSTIGKPLPFFDQLYLNDGINYGFQLNVPLFNGFAVRNQINRSRVNAKSAELNLEQTKLDLESSVYQAYLDARSARKAYEAAEVAAEAQELAYEYAKDRYDVGLTNAFDFSQSKQRYDNAQIELNRSKYDYIFRIKVVELYFGIPISEIKF
ncbi:MAG: TolC family protein [Leeuwenhoekiella sp.]